MTEQQPEQTERIDADVTPDDDVAGTSTGDPIAGVHISEEQADEAVEPEDNDAIEVDGPSQKHA
ncbi:hypothetical protein GCM10011519_20190 [Marmoricola endophyticus]|uniref:Uncharacterized protein n=1 Tax=Marmoricola endophyticus TaxID=2040280 RepID=A0A917BKX1_9ACTN|nr:hypothetical protein [Marmoricola endophyticus]GGF46223.1 hypothetical protein GCM10011519_20190 [Marmoricola endophyticus]